MKNFKVLLLTVVAALSLSSCFGEGDPNVTNQEFVKVENFYGNISFKSAGGYTIKPINQLDPMITAISSRFAQLVYQYNRNEVVYPVKEVNAKVLYADNILDMYYHPSQTVNENAPMASIMDGAATQVKFYDKDNIFLPVSFYYKASSDSNEQQKEVKSHHFELVPMENDNDASDIVTLRLVHNVDDVALDKDRKTVGSMFTHIDLSHVLGGKIPEKLVIKYKKAANNASFEEAYKDLGNITIYYRDIYERYFKPKNK